MPRRRGWCWPRARCCSAAAAWLGGERQRGARGRACSSIARSATPTPPIGARVSDYADVLRGRAVALFAAIGYGSSRRGVQALPRQHRSWSCRYPGIQVDAHYSRRIMPTRSGPQVRGCWCAPIPQSSTRAATRKFARSARRASAARVRRGGQLRRAFDGGQRAGARARPRRRRGVRLAGAGPHARLLD